MPPAEKNFLPDFCTLKMLLALFFLTELLAFLLTLAANDSTIGFLSDFFLRSLFALWIALPSAAILCGLRPFLPSFSHVLVGGIAFLIIQLITLAISYLAVTVIPAISLLFPELTTAEKFNFYSRIFGISALFSLAFLRYLYVLSQWQRHIEATAMAKLHALQARMRPHFLFNSLNSIASLTRINPLLAESMVEDLAQLIRASLTVDEKLLVPLAQEINLVELYLAIEKQRFEERLQVRWQLDNLPSNALLPPLSLQPLVENAIYYGIEPNPAGGEIVISGQLINNNLLIHIVNSYEMPFIREQEGNHIALTNLAARLNGCFDGTGSLQLNKTASHYQVTLKIPYQINQ